MMRSYPVEDVLGPNVTRLICLQHLKRNFWITTRPTSEQGFHRFIGRLVVIDPSAMIPERVSRRFGQRTFNAAESINNPQSPSVLMGCLIL